MHKNSSLQWLGFLFFITLFAGLTLRWQLAGHQLSGAANLDWRRAHSHLGFYGVLFPITWIGLQTFGVWTPTRKMWTIYGVLVTIAGLSFLLQGYGFFSILASTGILGVWLTFAWKNCRPLNFSKKDWLAPAPISIFLAAFLIPLVAIFTHRDPAFANEIARTFLTFLLFGVFIPAVLQMLELPPPRSWLWFVSTLASALFLTGLIPNSALGLGLIWIAFEILSSLSLGLKEKKWRDFRLMGAWGLFAMALALTGAGVLPSTYYQAIAGIHFLILGPLLMSFGLVQLKLLPNLWLRLAYEISLLTMVSSISLQSWMPYQLTLVSAVSGTLLVLSLLVIILTSLRRPL